MATTRLLVSCGIRIRSTSSQQLGLIVHFTASDSAKYYLDQANPLSSDKNVKGITDTVGDQFKEGNVLGGFGTGFSNEGMDKMETEKGWSGFAQKGVEGLPKSVAPAVGGVVPGLGGSTDSVKGMVPGLGGGK